MELSLNISYYPIQPFNMHNVCQNPHCLDNNHLSHICSYRFVIPELFLDFMIRAQTREAFRRSFYLPFQNKDFCWGFLLRFSPSLFSFDMHTYTHQQCTSETNCRNKVKEESPFTPSWTLEIKVGYKCKERQRERQREKSYRMPFQCQGQEPSIEIPMKDTSLS